MKELITKVINMCIFRRKPKSLLDHKLLVKAMKASCKEQAKFMKGANMPCGGKKKKGNTYYNECMEN